MLVFAYFLVFSLLFLICLHLGLNATIEKRVSKWLVLCRLSISALVIGKIVQLLRNLHFSWGINLIQALLLIVVMMLIEMGFRRKRLTFGDPHLNLVLEVLSLSVAIITLI